MKNIFVKTISTAFLILSINGCGAIDDAIDAIEDDGWNDFEKGSGVIYYQNNTDIYGNAWNYNPDNIGIQDPSGKYVIGSITYFDGIVLNIHGDFVANCIANEDAKGVENDGSFRDDDGMLQGSCHLDREVSSPELGEEIQH